MYLRVWFFLFSALVWSSLSIAWASTSSYSISEKRFLVDKDNQDIYERSVPYVQNLQLPYVFKRSGKGYAIFSDRKTNASTWIVFIDLNVLKLEVLKPKKTLDILSNFDDGCDVAINGGYFNLYGSLSILIRKGRLLAKDLQGLNRPRGKAYPSRAGLILNGEGFPSMTWMTHQKHELHTFQEPRDPYQTPPKAGTKIKAYELLQAGPMLVHQGLIADTLKKEAFARSIAPSSRHPRSAFAILEEDLFIFFVADGRRRSARGKTIKEVARLLHGLGAIEAMNLDGGGSTTLSIEQKIINRPPSGRQRKIASGLCAKPI